MELMDVYDQTSSSMRVKWDRVEASTGYILLYRPTSEPQLGKEVDVQLADCPHPTRVKANAERPRPYLCPSVENELLLCGLRSKMSFITFWLKVLKLL